MVLLIITFEIVGFLPIIKMKFKNEKAMESRDKPSTTYLEFEDNSLLIELFGSQESNLKLLEKELPVIISTRGNQVVIQGEEESARSR